VFLYGIRPLSLAMAGRRGRGRPVPLAARRRAEAHRTCSGNLREALTTFSPKNILSQPMLYRPAHPRFTAMSYKRTHRLGTGVPFPSGGPCP
jgi:hypothetical protein